MRYLILGGSGFIGSNLIVDILTHPENNVVTFSRTSLDDKIYNIIKYKENLEMINGDFSNIDFEFITKNIDVVVHLISTTTPSNTNYEYDIRDNVLPTLKLLNACVKNSVEKFIFISSGGTVYGKTPMLPIKETHNTNPICSYGIQKLMIEKYIMLYHNNYGLNSKIIRLANPFGPHQEAASGVGAITNFTVKCMRNEPITIYGNGEVVRDYIYIDDAIKGILNIIESSSNNIIFNLGTGIGTNLNEIIGILKNVFNRNFNVVYKDGRNVDVEYNVLDIGKYSSIAPEHKMITIHQGILKLGTYLSDDKELNLTN